MAAKIAGLVHTVQLKLKIESCTSSQDEPTPLYRMDEIIDVVNRDPKNIADAVDCLEQRLQFRSAVVKQKALRLIKHIAQHGSGEFRRGLLRLSPVIRDLTHFKCAPDPFKGDIPWKKVQQGAREAMEVIHNDGGSSDPGMSSHRTMMDGFGRAGESGRGILDAPSHGSGMDFFGTSGLLNVSSSMSERRVGGSSYARPRIDSHGGPMRDRGTEDGPRQQRSMEEKMVHTFCTPKQHGVRIAPSMEECKSFRSEIAGRDGRSVAVHLEKEIQHGDWKGCLRALCALESISEHGQNSTESDIIEYFRNNAESLKRAENSAQDRVRTKSLSVMSRIGILQPKVEAQGSDLLSTEDDTTPQSKPIEQEMDALSLLESLDEQEQPNSPVAGLIFSDVESTTIKNESERRVSDPFGDWETGEFSKPAQAHADPFGGMFGGTENDAPKQTTAPPAAVLDDFFTSIPDQTTNGSVNIPTFEIPAAPTNTDQSGTLLGTPQNRQTPDILGAWHATTSGFTGSQAREESAFNFVQVTMESARKK